MEDLIGLLVTAAMFVFWIAQSVMTSKKQTQQEFEEAWKEFEADQDEEEVEWLDEPEPAPPPPRREPAKPQPAAQPGAQTWKQLQKQLEEILKQNTQTQPVMPERREESPRPLPTPPPRAETVPTAPFPPQPARLDDYRPRPKPAPVIRPAAVSRSEALRTTEFDFRERRKTRSKFPYLHPHPVYNAILLGEVIKPYSRNPIYAQRPHIGQSS